MSTDEPTTPETPPDEASSRRRALLRRTLLSGFTGALLGLSLVADVRGFYLGLLVGVATQALIRGLFGLTSEERQNTFKGLMFSAAAGLIVGVVTAWIVDHDLLSVLLCVGVVVSVVDFVLSWVLFPTRGRGSTAVPEVEDGLDPDADLRDPEAYDEPESPPEPGDEH